MEKRLFRSRRDRVLAGVCGGLAEYLNVDPNIVRLVWALVSFPGAVGIPLYILAWILVPATPGGPEEVEVEESPAPRAGSQASPDRRTRWIGGLLLGLGALFLLNNLAPWFHAGRLWPLALIAVGLALLIRGPRD